MTDEELRSAYARAVEQRGTSTRAGCPPLEALVAVVERRGGEAARLATLDHAMACGAGCASELELLRSMRVAANAAEPAARGGVTSLSAWRARWTLPAAAAAVLLVGVGLVATRRDRAGGARDPDVVRGSDASSVTLVAPGDGDTVGDSARLVWHPVAGARSYTVEVLSPGTDVTSSAVTHDTSWVWRPGGRAAPGEYRWWVRGTDVDGVVHESPMQRFRAGVARP